MDDVRAQQVMLEVHHLGQAICGVYVREVAEMKVSETMKMARAHDFPLRCIFEKAI
jgi:ATP-dependent Clp protease adaptor protein ClpS